MSRVRWMSHLLVCKGLRSITLEGEQIPLVNGFVEIGHFKIWLMRISNNVSTPKHLQL